MDRYMNEYVDRLMNGWTDMVKLLPSAFAFTWLVSAFLVAYVSYLSMSLEAVVSRYKDK